MTLAFDFHPEARDELAAEVDWYDDRQRDLGGRFADAVRAAVNAAAEDPHTWPTWPGWDREPMVRSKGVSDFPHRIVYFVQNDLVTIVAVAHTRRRPGYWRDRVRAVPST